MKLKYLILLFTTVFLGIPHLLKCHHQILMQ